MKTPILRALHVILLICFSNILMAEDTLKIISHERTHMNWYGAFREQTFFPTKSESYRKVVLNYTLGCPDKGCSEWDYTTQVFINHKDGTLDSTTRTRSSLFIQNQPIDSFAGIKSVLYDTIITSNGLQARARVPQTIYVYGNEQDPFLLTDSLTLWDPFYQILNEQDSVIETRQLQPDTLLIAETWTYYETRPRIIKYEISRLITPYANGFTKDWKRTFFADVTDYLPLLQDSVEIELFYSGYQDGFTGDLRFDFIKGNAVKNAQKIELLYRGSFDYGNPNRSIETHLIPKKFLFDTAYQEAKLIVLQTGHGFGGNENCAEFCPKYHYIKINGQEQYKKLIWRDDCGLNPIFPQPGTWLYDRSNWCPGDIVQPLYYDLTPHISSGDSFEIDIDMDPFTNVGNNFCSYIISAQIVYYDKKRNVRDAELIDIVAPNNDFRFSRQNPNCFQPIFRVLNTGAIDIFSLEFTYGTANGPKQSSSWAGEIKVGAQQDIELWQPNFADPNGDNKFYCKITSINGHPLMADDGTKEKTSHYAITPHLKNNLVIQLRTNNQPEQNTLTIQNNDGNIYLSKTYTQANTLYRDTVSLPSGCFKFLFEDKGKNGLSFWAFPAGGNGNLQLRSIDGDLYRNFQSDFGTAIEYYFTTTYTMATPTFETVSKDVYIFPNPATDNVSIDLSDFEKASDFSIKVLDITGKRITLSSPIYLENSIQLDTKNMSRGVYILELKHKEGVFSKKLILE